MNDNIAKSVDVQLKMRSSRLFENGIFSCQCPRPQGLCAHDLSRLARPRVTPSAFLNIFGCRFAVISKLFHFEYV